MPDDDRTLLKICAYLCCESPRSQKEIATLLTLSEKQVSQLVSSAKKEGYLRRVFHPPGDEKVGMELEHRVAGFGVRRVEVVGCAHSVGHAAARFFEREAKSGQTLVLDGGKTVGAFVEALASHAFERMTIIPICADPASCEIAAYELVTRVAVKYPIAGTCEKLPYWHGPHLDEIHDRIRRRARKADFVILGAGPWQRHYTALDFVKHLGLDSEAIYAKYRGRVCGVVGYCAVARDGHHVTLKEIDERLPRSLDFDDLKRMAESNRCRCILVAAGARKVEAVTAVLAARVVNTLILDRRLATCLLTRLGTRR